MFTSRYFLHKQMYSHKVVKGKIIDLVILKKKGIELMIGDVLKEADKELEISKILKEKNYEKYALLTDSILKEIERSPKKELNEGFFFKYFI